MLRPAPKALSCDASCFLLGHVLYRQYPRNFAAMHCSQNVVMASTEGCAAEGNQRGPLPHEFARRGAQRKEYKVCTLKPALERALPRRTVGPAVRTVPAATSMNCCVCVSARERSTRASFSSTPRWFTRSTPPGTPCVTHSRAWRTKACC